MNEIRKAQSATKDLFQVLRKTKPSDQHLKVVEALVDADLLFIETQEMIYRITNTCFDNAILFARTGKLQVRTGLREEVKQGSFQELVVIMKG